MSTNDKSIFVRPLWVSIFALTAAVAWGWAYPLIKLGFAEFHITPDLTGSKILFAGIRFCISGLIILGVARTGNKSFAIRRSADWWYILLFTLLNTTIHYTCFYIGLSYAPGARSAILNSLSVFSVVILACLFFKSDKMTIRKLMGCMIGFAGILALNIGGERSGSGFTLMGDGMIVLNALSGAAASLLARGLGRRVNVFVGTGYSLALGGLMLMAGHHLSVAADSHQHRRLHPLQQVAHLQSCGQSGHLQLADTCGGSRHQLPLSGRNVLLEIRVGRLTCHCRHMHHQSGKAMTEVLHC